MLKKITLILVSSILMISTASANDDLLSELANGKGVNVTDASVEVEDFDLDVDVDELAENASDDDDDAMEACFRRFGYRSWGYNYGCYRPVYRSYSYYRPLLCQPVYHSYSYCAPIISHYWGCY